MISSVSMDILGRDFAFYISGFVVFLFTGFAIIIIIEN